MDFVLPRGREGIKNAENLADVICERPERERGEGLLAASARLYKSATLSKLNSLSNFHFDGSH